MYGMQYPGMGMGMGMGMQVGMGPAVQPGIGMVRCYLSMYVCRQVVCQFPKIWAEEPRTGDTDVASDKDLCDQNLVHCHYLNAQYQSSSCYATVLPRAHSLAQCSDARL